MKELKELSKRISEMRDNLNRLIENSDNLLDSEVLGASEEMDNILNEYEKLIREKQLEKNSN